MQTVVVTGGAGFIGSHLVHELIQRNVKVHIIDNLSTGTAERVHPDAILHVQDICSSEAPKTILEIQPDVVFHLAAQADVQQSIHDPVSDMDINIGGTLNLLYASRKASVRKFIFASTSGVYGNLQKEILTETDPTDPISFYGLSKLAAENYIRLFEQCYRFPYAILRFSNVYGPGQTAKGEGGVVSIFMNQLHSGLPLYVNGDGEQTRDFIYVKDVTQALIAAMEHAHQETFHVSTGTKTSVNRLIELLQDVHVDRIEKIYRESKQGDIRNSCLSNELIYSRLNWRPVYSIEQGLSETYHSF